MGAWNTVFGFLAFAGLYGVTQAFHLHYMWAMVGAHILAVTNAYFCYRWFVFGEAKGGARAYLRFSMVYAWSFAFNAVALPFSVTVLHLHPVAAQGLLMGLTAIISYFAHGRFSFNVQSPR